MQAAAWFDVLVIGSGPGGQKASVQAAKAGRSVAVIERELLVGGACVSRGTIPSKTLRESALRATRLRQGAQIFDVQLRAEIELASLMGHVDEVVAAHAAYMGAQLDRNGIQRIHGRAHFTSPHQLEVRTVSGAIESVGGKVIVLATGSRPRAPSGIAVDHENILDSDSVLSMIYLPASMIVLGGGVIASEYASIFANLGVQVTMIDRADRPLRFMDGELVGHFEAAFRRAGGRFLGERTMLSAEWDGVSQVVCRLEGGEELRAEKLLVAQGRLANLEELGLAAAGLLPSARGLLEVDEHCRTAVPHIYGVGDVIGPPALAATAMEQGRRAVCHALGLPPGNAPELIPVGIYTIPEIASVGISEEQASARFGHLVVGRARFDEVARGQISSMKEGLLKLIADPEGRKLLGVHIVGEGACELIHLGQIALAAGWEVDGFVEQIFNFPTLAEAYRVAALDIVGRRRARPRAVAV